MRRNEPDLLGGLVIQVPPVPFTLGVLPGFGPVDGLFLGATYDRTVDDATASGALGWSHTFGYRNVLNTAVFATGFKRDSDESSLVVFDTALFGTLAGQQTAEASTEQQTYWGR